MDIEGLYRTYGPMVLRRCRRLLKNEDEALDAMQDVFARLVQYSARLDDQYPSSLLFRMATNVCLNRLRDGRVRSSTQPIEESADQLVSQVALVSEVEARSLLDRIFRRHKEGTRTIAILHYLDGMTLEETARESGLSVSGVRKRLRSLRATLQELETI